MIKFISDDIWTIINSLADKSKRTKAAVAYFGAGATTLLKLKKGDILLVAITLNNVKAGQVNPFEIEKLLHKGVFVYNLPNLHSKVYLFDNKVIIGSANVSSNSADNLIETGVLTDDSKTVLQADRFIKDHCIEKVEQDYVEVCKKNYSPPKFFGSRQKIKFGEKFRGQLSRLWFISTKNIEFKDEDWQTLEQDKKVFEKKISNKRVFELSEIKYPASSSFIQQVREGDIIIEVVTHKVKANVIQPKRALGVTWNKKKSNGFLRVEERIKRKTKSWTQLQSTLRQNGIKAITKNSTREIKNETTKKYYWISSTNTTSPSGAFYLKNQIFSHRRCSPLLAQASACACLKKLLIIPLLQKFSY